MRKYIGIAVVLLSVLNSLAAPTNWSYTVKINIDATNDNIVTDWVKNLPPLYTNVIVITNGVTNITVEVVDETVRQKIKRHTSTIIYNWISTEINSLDEKILISNADTIIHSARTNMEANINNIRSRTLISTE